MNEVLIGKFGYIKQQTIDWISSHVFVFSACVLSVVLLLVGASRFLGWFSRDPQVDFVAADLAYQHWEGTPETLGRLEKLLKKHPELHAKYDGVIAQRLLSSSQQGLAASYASAQLKRVAHLSPHYVKFSEGSILIAEGHLSEALSAAKELKGLMEKDTSFWEKRSSVAGHGSLLYGYNLLRIAILEGKVGSSKDELAAWQELKANAGWLGVKPESKTYDPEAYLLIQKNFQNQNTSLLDFIQYREEILKRG